MPWFLVLAMRHRSFTVWTAANPGIPAGGVVGESKADILAQLPAESVCRRCSSHPAKRMTG